MHKKDILMQIAWTSEQPTTLKGQNHHQKLSIYLAHTDSSQEGYN